MKRWVKSRRVETILEMLETEIESKHKGLITKHAFGTCDNCDDLSSDLILENTQWICGDCREEFKIRSEVI